MDYLFKTLQKSNFEMTDDQLMLWQRTAIFECHSENFINRRIEISLERREQGQVSQVANLSRRPLIEQSAIDMAIDQHGLRIMDPDLGPSPAQRPHLMQFNAFRSWLMLLTDRGPPI